MTAIILGGVGLLALLLFARAYTRVDPHTLAQGMRSGIVLICIVVGIALIATGRFGFIFLPIGALLALFASRRRPQPQAEYGGDAPRARSGAMTRSEALSVLGLKEGASEEVILAAYRKLMMQNHPDKGGSTYLAAKINQAKDVLLGK